MKALSSIDIHCLAKELKSLEGSRVDNIYQKGKEEFLFQLHKTSEGKKLLRILMGKALFLTPHKGEMETLSGFCMLLRKHLGNAFIASISQIEPERIVRITFEAKEGVYNLYIEFLGKGNIVLCKEDGTIIDALLHQEFKDRTIAPKQKYKHPQMGYNVFALDSGYLSSLLTSTTKGSLVKCLAIDLGLGGMYGEEACANAKVDKNKNPNELDSKEKSLLLEAISSLAEHPTEPVVVMKDGAVSEVFPFKLNTFSGEDSQSFPSLSEGLEHYYSHVREQVSTSYDSKVAELRRITEQ
ncbi:MAG: NFACT family protein, partial [Candidatus Aenigmarchaeota archaeon]|nr:NFACT family protein [Candidatus Aenigmarchaeota archaeon]